MNFNIALMAILFFTANVFAANLKSKPRHREFAKGRILIEAKAGLSDDELTKILAVHGGKGRKMGRSKLQIVNLPANASEADIIAKLSKNPNIKFAELDEKIEATFTPNDSYYSSQWGVSKAGINLAWDLAMGAGVTIAILDSGVDPTHPDLIPNLVPGYNFYDYDTNTADVCGHGTAVAGVAAAAGNNAIGVAGVAMRSKIMPVRIAYYDYSIGSCYAYTSTIADGIMYAADHGARVVNVSYGPLADSSTIQSAGTYLKSTGGLLFMSAGNTGLDEGSFSTTSLIAVSATDINDAKASWSSYGSFVSLSAPGANILTTNNGGSYGSWNGTSFASPLVAGVAALVMSAKPSLTGDEVENILFTTAVDLGTPGRDSSFGYGRVNANAAVQAALGSGPAPDTQSPTSVITSPVPGATVSGVVTVTVSATDNVAVEHVELRVNGATAAVDSSAPYSMTWDSKTVANGSVSLVAVAFDAAGNSKASSAFSVIVSNVVTPPPDTQAPTSVITSPAPASKVSGLVNVAVNATDNVVVDHVDLRVNGITVASDSSSPFNLSWDSKTIANGTASLVAVAFDAAGNSKSSTAISVTVSNDTTAPTSKITSPTAGAVVKGVITVAAAATDNVAVDHVDLQVNGTTIATDSTSPYSFSWDTKTIANGSVSLVAVAFDKAGNSKASTAFSVTVSNDTTAPVVKINSPTVGATVSGLVTVAVTATDNVAVHHVDLQVNGVTVATDTAAPYSFSWDSKTVANGAASLVAVAFDAAGNSTATTAFSVTVYNIPPDTTAPVVTINSPTAGKVTANVNINVTASDNSGVTGLTISISIDGIVKATGTGGGSLTYNWVTSSAAAGSHTIKATATDKAGNKSTATVLMTK